MRQSYAHDLGQAALGAGREAGRPCLYCYHNNETYLVLYSSDIKHTPHARWLRAGHRYESVLEFHNDPPSRLRSNNSEGKAGVYVIRLGSTLPRDTLLERTWYLVSLVEAAPDTNWVDRGLIISISNVIVARLLCA